VIALLIVLVVLDASPAQQPSASAAALAGPLSCSSRACHGDVGGVGDRNRQPTRFSYSVWSVEDRHAEAYQVLLGERGKAIGRNLNPKIDRPEEDVRCLACHVTPQLASGNLPVQAREQRVFGVGCEACHGPAEKWLKPHAELEWNQLNDQSRRDRYVHSDMTWLRDLNSRAQVCTGCHVGAPVDPARSLPARDVNHDLIAAGHPRLLFEFSAFLANMPKHWSEPDLDPLFEARAWASGQVVSAQSALELLANRAAHAEQKSQPWPEFAEYDCFACHHDLQPSSWRQRRLNATRKLGSLAWETWYTTLLPDVLSNPEWSRMETSLRTAMSQPRPNAGDIRKQALDAVQLLRNEIPAVHQRVARLPETLDRTYLATQTGDWSQARQLALGLLAVHRAAEHRLTQKNPDAVKQEREAVAAIEAWLRQLALPDGSDSPHGFQPDKTFDIQLRTLLERKAKP
jgi:Cytochrome c554 and c-prime